MSEGPKIKGNPLKISVYLLVVSFILGGFVFPRYHLLYAINLIGIIGLLVSMIFFFLGFNIFKSQRENPRPKSPSNKLIKTGIFSYTRNPIYLSFILLHFSMFLVFENVMYFLTALGLSYWIHNYVIKFEEDYLLKTFSDEYKSYMSSVSRWLLL